MKSLALLALSGCQLVYGHEPDEPPAAFAGTYTAMVTNGTDECNIGWMVGMAETANVVITQGADGELAIDVQDGLGVLLQLVYVKSVFIGKANGRRFELQLVRDQPVQGDGCLVAPRIDLVGILLEDELTIEGNLEHSQMRTGPNCPSPTCQSFQTYDAIRLP